jgi:integrase
MALIRQHYQDQGVNQQNAEFIAKPTRSSTATAYDLNWEKWVRWCLNQSPQINPVAYHPPAVVAWLSTYQSSSRSYLNTLRSAIASVFSVLHRDQLPIHQNALVNNYFAAIRRRPQPLKLMDDGIWDINLILQLVDSWGPSDRLPLALLQNKVMVVLAVATMWRPRSDLGRLQYRDVLKYDSHAKYGSGYKLISREPKEADSKVSYVAPLSFTSNLCPVLTLVLFLDRTVDLRMSLPVDHTLFLAYIDHKVRSVSSIQPKTLASSIKRLMSQAGIDTSRFGPHTIRSAASTAVVQGGGKRSNVKSHAGWSLNSSTFEKYYYRPNTLFRSSHTIMKRLFSGTDKVTTSGVEAEASTIVVGTTHNQARC